MKLAALAHSVAARLNRAAVELDEREPDAHAGARFHIVGMNLLEQLEDFRKLTGWNTDAGVVDAHDAFLAFCRCGRTSGEPTGCISSCRKNGIGPRPVPRRVSLGSATVLRTG